MFYKRYTGNVKATDYIEWAAGQLHMNTYELKKLAAMKVDGQLNRFEVEKMFDEAMASIGSDAPSKNHCFEHHFKRLHAKLLLPNENALAILKEIYDFAVTNELFEEQMKWQEVSDAADDFQYGDNYYGYTKEKIHEMILGNARKLWNGKISDITFNEFVGQKIMAADPEVNFIVQLEKGAIVIECPWRIRSIEGIVIGETDVRHNSGEWATVKDLLIGRTIQDVQMFENCPFLIVQCDDLFLDLFHASTFYDGWTLNGEGDTYIFSMHGGSIA